ncbi:ABC transporter ATP-binding protein [Streptomyces hainanensis]|uniref:ABC transporter ATP-binding protein n=1 Tax=Streptomyces hainanensis TaxID=402648 RepID=A0A4R4TK73_9ACTN|nr:ABC transporter ATP-binding protein [Streptomyces hainanensis]TDC78328.1 ABC transporter ATP-binding protein [Streptomyces hainanensis]
MNKSSLDPVSVRAHDLRVTRGRVQVLKGLDFTVRRGGVTGLLGPSGCGKTTLMRAIAGIQARATGTLEVLGRPAGSPALRPLIGYVTQAPSVYLDLTVRQNLEYYAAVLGVPRADPAMGAPPWGHLPAARLGAVSRGRVDAALADVDLTSHAGALAADLSGGQRSRASLAVALLGSPELLVLDEPTVGLDPVLRRGLWELFHRLAGQHGVTLLISSHVMDEADRCERLLLMRAGRLLADGTPAELRRRTGADTVEEAFLRLVDDADDADDAGDADDSAARAGESV